MPFATSENGASKTATVSPSRDDLHALVPAARAAQSLWSRTSLNERVRILRQFRQHVANDAERLVASLELPDRSPAETLAAEILPLASACQFLERNLQSALKPRRYRSWLRWLGLSATSIEIRRQPLGVVLIIGPANYPLFLPGVQTLQALAAGNAVLLKPGRGGRKVALRLAALLQAAGLPDGLLHVTDESPQSAEAAITASVDKVFLTGSLATGRAILSRLADSVTPAVMELSGCDTLVVLADADLQRVVRCIRFAARFNRGETCIAPRRFFCHRSQLSALNRISPKVDWVPFDSESEAISLVNASEYALGLSIFGKPALAQRLADRMNAGCVTINDLIAPTADPRLPFGGRKLSGFGTTRGLEGLLEMTVVQAVSIRHGSWLPHLNDPSTGDAAILSSWLRMLHSNTIAVRLAGLRTLIRAVRGEGSSPEEKR